jgi:hypothetical protein
MLEKEKIEVLMEKVKKGLYIPFVASMSFTFFLFLFTFTFTLLLLLYGGEAFQSGTSVEDHPP